VEQAFTMIESLVGLHGLHSDRLASVFGPGKALVLGLALVLAFLMPNTQQLIDHGVSPQPAAGRLRLLWHPTLAWSAVIAALLFLSLTQMSTNREFVYFQF
jgi:hypothetical protein